MFNQSVRAAINKGTCRRFLKVKIPENLSEILSQIETVPSWSREPTVQIIMEIVWLGHKETFIYLA